MRQLNGPLYQRYRDWLTAHPRLDWIAWKLYRARVWLPSKLGHWESEHGYKECPSGERYCIHMHWRPGLKCTCGCRDRS